MEKLRDCVIQNLQDLSKCLYLKDKDEQIIVYSNSNFEIRDCDHRCGCNVMSCALSDRWLCNTSGDDCFDGTNLLIIVICVVIFLLCIPLINYGCYRLFSRQN